MTKKLVIAILALSGILVVVGGLVGVLSRGIVHNIGMTALIVGGVGAVVGLVGLSFGKQKDN